jgi:hypothetical protein
LGVWRAWLIASGGFAEGVGSLVGAGFFLHELAKKVVEEMIKAVE